MPPDGSFHGAFDRRQDTARRRTEGHDEPAQSRGAVGSHVCGMALRHLYGGADGRADGDGARVRLAAVESVLSAGRYSL